MKNEVVIIAHPNKQEVLITREFDAPRELVFQAHTDPKLLVQWLGPANRKMVIEKYDARSGGSYRYFVVNEEGKPIASFNGAHHEVTAPERIIQTFEFEGLPERGHVTLDTTLFESLPGNRTKVTIHSVFRSVNDRDAMLQSGFERGIIDGYRKLDSLLQASNK